MNKGMYFGSSSEDIAKIITDRQSADKPTGFVFGQSGKGYGIHVDSQPSGMALAARQEMESAMQSVLDTVVIIDSDRIDPEIDVESMRESIIQKLWRYARYYCGKNPETFDELTEAIGLTKEEFLYLMDIEELG